MNATLVMMSWEHHQQGDNRYTNTGQRVEALQLFWLHSNDAAEDVWSSGWCRMAEKLQRHSLFWSSSLSRRLTFGRRHCYFAGHSSASFNLTKVSHGFYFSPVQRLLWDELNLWQNVANLIEGVTWPHDLIDINCTSFSLADSSMSYLTLNQLKPNKTEQYPRNTMWVQHVTGTWPFAAL